MEEWIRATKGPEAMLYVLRLVRKSPAVLLAGLLLYTLSVALAPTWAPALAPAWAADTDNKSGKANLLKKPDAVYLILMVEPPANHVIEMPGMIECIKAMQFSPSAKCTRGATPKAISDFKALQKSGDYLPASGPAVK